MIFANMKGHPNPVNADYQIASAHQFIQAVIEANKNGK
jgi:hypothetical protein